MRSPLLELRQPVAKELVRGLQLSFAKFEVSQCQNDLNTGRADPAKSFFQLQGCCVVLLRACQITPLQHQVAQHLESVCMLKMLGDQHLESVCMLMAGRGALL